MKQLGWQNSFKHSAKSVTAHKTAGKKKSVVEMTFCAEPCAVILNNVNICCAEIGWTRYSINASDYYVFRKGLGFVRLHGTCFLRMRCFNFFLSYF